MANSGFHFENTYANLPPQFLERQNPVPVREPKMAVFNHALAASLGLNGAALSLQPELFSGNKLPAGADPIAQAYAGHQFGHLNMLGDGRAILLGEHVTPGGERVDIQLKGSGQTPFSRRGDGRAALGPMLREYIISEAMHALGIPTTRSLAVVTTGETVFREKPLPGAILTRVASSHIRVGTFVYSARVEEPESLRVLADYTIARHYPQLLTEAEPYLSFLQAVIEKQAALVAQWMLVGFIHGVMNTDNVSVTGETIDYGPCAFMNHYSPATVFSSIDRNGRYAFGNQPRIANWNLERFAEALAPLLHSDQSQAAGKAKDAVAGFSRHYQCHWLEGMRAKLGLAGEEPADLLLIEELLEWMEKSEADYTNTFRALSEELLPTETKWREGGFPEWHARWKARSPDKALMRSRNPAVIPRNHRVEEALEAAVERDDYTVMERLLAVLKTPFADSPGSEEYRQPGTGMYQTFCGT